MAERLTKYGNTTHENEVDRKKWFDPMLAFAEIYGEWDSYYGNYRWQSLTKCAKYYGYEFKAHDSLEDVKATLYCYKKMTIEFDYRAALVDYEFAKTEDEKRKALQKLKSLEELAALKYGFDYADELHRREFRNVRDVVQDALIITHRQKDTF